MIQTIYQHLAAQFKLPLDNTNYTGTIIKPNPERKPSASQVVWTFDTHVVIDCHPKFVSQFEALIEEGEMLTVDTIADKLGVRVLEQDNMYSISRATFQQQTITYTVRQLLHDDHDAFEAFLANCSEQDKEYGEIGLGDEVIYGVLDDERIIAVASSFEWHGFVDVGVLTDPAYRGQGAGRATIAAVVKHYLDRDEQRLLLYRHETSNIGSMKIAISVGWQRFATVDFLRFEGVSA